MLGIQAFRCIKFHSLCRMAERMGNNTSKLHYIKPRIEEWESAHNRNRQYEVKLSRIRIGHTRLTHGHLMTRNSQQPTCGSAACGNQSLTIKHCPNGGTVEQNTVSKVT